MNIKGNIAAQFLDFEKKNNLFDLQDFKGTYYWDIIRYYVYIKLIYQEDPLIKKKKKRNYLLILKRILNSIFLFFDCSKKQYLFYLASRDKDAHRRSVDRILKPSCDLLKEKKHKYYVAGYKEVFITGKKVNAGDDREIKKMQKLVKNLAD